MTDEQEYAESLEREIAALTIKCEEIEKQRDDAAILIEKIGTTGAERIDIIQKADAWLAKYKAEQANLNK
jgi:hypothetical protein